MFLCRFDGHLLMDWTKNSQKMFVSAFPRKITQVLLCHRHLSSPFPKIIPQICVCHGSTAASGKRKKLVILGTGWASYSVLKSVNKNLYDVIVVSPRNHFLFTPLLASTTVGTLEFRSIIEPIRNVGFRQTDHFHLSEAVGIDVEKKELYCRSVLKPELTYNIDYDKLVVGVGAVSNTFGIPGVSEHAFFLKEVQDARAIRNRILNNFELALHPSISQEERRRLLHIIIVGGGPTGVEFGAELYDFVREVRFGVGLLGKFFHHDFIPYKLFIFSIHTLRSPFPPVGCLPSL